MLLGTPLTPIATKALLLGSGELGKEITIELQRYGVEVIACDKYANAPAMQVAHRCHVFNMLDGEALRRVVEEEKPTLIIPRGGGNCHTHAGGVGERRLSCHTHCQRSFPDDEP